MTWQRLDHNLKKNTRADFADNSNLKNPAINCAFFLTTGLNKMEWLADISKVVVFFNETLDYLTKNKEWVFRVNAKKVTKKKKENI